jgi:hypothetical protein
MDRSIIHAIFKLQNQKGRHHFRDLGLDGGRYCDGFAQIHLAIEPEKPVAR